VRLITGIDEQELCNSNLLNKRLVEKYIVENLVVSPKVPLTEWLAMDVEALILNVRIMNYGPTFKFQWKCSACDTDNKSEVNLAGFEQYPLIPSILDGNQACAHPIGEKLLVFRPPTWTEKQDSKDSIVDLLKKVIVEVPGDGPVIKREEVDGLPAKLSKQIRKLLSRGLPYFSTDIKVSCDKCATKISSSLEVNQDIFGFDPKTKGDILAQIFDLCYYGQGGFTVSEVEQMETTKRSFFYGKLIEAKKKEEESAKGAEKTPPKIARPPSVK
jgi:hypothetical protein